MKKRIFITFFVLLSFFSVQATQYLVHNVDEFNTAMNNYAAGDEIILSEGTYNIGATKTITKDLILKADPVAETKPVLAQIMFAFSTSDCSLQIKGLEIYWDLENAASPTASRYLISSTAGAITISNLMLTDCTIHGYGRALLRSDGSTVSTIQQLVVDNCLIYDMGRESNSYSIFAVKTALIAKADFTNTTIYNCKNGFWYSEVKTSPINFKIENCCIFKTTASGSKLLINTNANPGSVYTIRNSIISDSYDDSTSGMQLKLNSNNSDILAHIDNSILANDFAATKVVGTLTTDNQISVTSLSFDFNEMIIQTEPTTITGIGDPKWKLNPAVSSPAILTISVDPDDAGAIDVTPLKNPYNSGDEITLTATRNFGYDFKEWKNADTDETLSSASSYTFNIVSDIHIKAVFEPLTTYNLTLNIAGSQWGEVSLTPVPTNGKYEAGTVVTAKVVSNAVTNFLYWDDMSTDNTKVVQMNNDVTLTATFDEVPFIVGWNFKVQEPRSNRPGDFYSESSNMGLISLYEPNGTAVNWLANTGSFNPSYPCARIWTSGTNFATNRRYFQASFATLGYSNIQVKSMVSGNYQCYSVQKLQYSLDGTNFTDLTTADITDVYNSGWKNLDATLPAEAENQNRVYLRWIADENSPILGNSTDNDGTALTNVYVFANKIPAVDPDPPVLISTIPAQNAINVSANGSITLVFNEQVKKGSGDCLLGSAVLTPTFASKTVTFAYSKLSYNSDYTFTVPAGALVDLAGNPFEGITIQFHTMNRQQPIARLFDVVVAKDGSGDYTTIQAALDAVPANRTAPWLIFIKNGTYEELVRIPSNKPFIHLIGQDKDKVKITFAINCSSSASDLGWEYSKSKFGMSDCSCMVSESTDFYAENISFENKYGVEAQNGPQALAIRTANDRFAFYHCNLRSFQDTWQTTSTDNQRHYAYKCRIEGAVDYIYNNGNVLVEQCTLYNLRKGSVIVAPSHKAATNWGYVFRDCTIDGNTSAIEGNNAFGRPWHNAPQAVFINSKVLIPMKTEGWLDMGAIPKIFAEYNSFNANGQLLDLSGRKTTYSYTDSGTGEVITGNVEKNVLTDEEAAQYSYENVIMASDGWDPRQYFEPVAKPENVKAENKYLTWNACDYAICYVVLRNDSVIGFTTTPSFSDNSAELNQNYSYVIKAVNEYGSLSEASEVCNTIFTGFTKFNYNQIAKPVIVVNENRELIISKIGQGTNISLFSIEGKKIFSDISTSNEYRHAFNSLKGIFVLRLNENSYKIIF